MQLLPAVIRDLGALLPDTSLYSGIGPQAIMPWSGLTDPMLQKTAAAALSLQDVLHHRMADYQDLVWFATYGFIAIDDGVRATLRRNEGFNLLSSGFTFGVAILMPRGQAEGSQRVLTYINLAGQVFPVIEIIGTVTLHGTPPHPNGTTANGTSACWATHRVAGGWADGIITAGHVVTGLTLGTSVPLTPSGHHSTPGSASVADVGPCQIDAAVLEVSSLPSSVTSTLGVLDPARFPIAPGAATRFETASAAVMGKVLRVNQNPGYPGPMMPERIVFDTPGVPGDSGALVAEYGSSDGYGIYMGTIPSVGGTTDGVAQGLWQAAQWFDADLLD